MAVKWTEQFQIYFVCLKIILIYPEASDNCYLYTYASKYAWSTFLTQKHIHTDKTDNTVAVCQSITFLSGILADSQQRYSASTEKCYILYIPVKKVSTCLESK